MTSEGITGVIALNEPYELNLCSYQKPGWQQLGVTISISTKIKAVSRADQYGPGGIPEPAHHGPVQRAEPAEAGGRGRLDG